MQNDNYGKDYKPSTGFPLAIILCAIITITAYLVLSEDLLSHPRLSARVFVPLAGEANQMSP